MNKSFSLTAIATLIIVEAFALFYLRTPTGEAEIALAPTPTPSVYVSPTLEPTPVRAKTAEQEAQEVRSVQILAALPVVSVGQPRLVRHWDALTMTYGLDFSPDGAFLAVAGSNSNSSEDGVDLRSTANWKSQGALPKYVDYAWSPNSRFLAIENDGIDIWDVRAHRIVANLADGSGLDGLGGKGSAGVFGPMIFSADSSKIITFGEDPNSKWKLDNGPNTEAAYVHGIAKKVWNVADGKRLKVETGFSSNGGRGLVRTSNAPSELNFATTIGRSYSVSNTQPPIYLTFGSSQAVLFGRRSQPQFSYASFFVPLSNINIVIAGNAWIYGFATNDAGGRQIVQICRTRDQSLLQSFPLPDPDRVTALAISPDAQIVAVAQDHHIEKKIADKTYGNLTVSQSRVSIYRLNTKKP